MDKETIEHANRAIKEVYSKFDNSELLKIVSKEDILIREFDNFFVFEDFFDNFSKRTGLKKEDILQDIVDTIEVNAGKITIEELVSAITSPPDYLLKKEEKGTTDTNDTELFKGKRPDFFEVVEDGKSIMDLSDLNTKGEEIFEKMVRDQNKKIFFVKKNRKF